MSDQETLRRIGESVPERFVDLLVIHCAATPNGGSLFIGKPGDDHFMTPDLVIDIGHVKRGFRRAETWRKRFNPGLVAIGYHFLIGANGALYTGRHIDEIGSHAHISGKTYNQRSLGISMLGTDRFTLAQWERLAQLVAVLQRKYEKVQDFKIVGHRDLSPDLDDDGVVEEVEWLKICPGFDVAAWLANGMRPDPAHVFDPQPPAAAMKQAA